LPRSRDALDPLVVQGGADALAAPIGTTQFEAFMRGDDQGVRARATVASNPMKGWH
jgi:hypothetical protein